MKRLSIKTSQAFTRVELVIVILAVVILAVLTLILAVIIPAGARSRESTFRLCCVNDLKELGTAYRLWANDHNDLMPFQAFMANGGLSELLTKTNAGQHCWEVYALLQNELGQSPKLLVCPDDERIAAGNFIPVGTTNSTGTYAFKDNTTLSYFVGVTASDLYPQAILGGDRNLGPGLVPDPNYGFSPTNSLGNDVTLYTNSPVSWSLKMHSHGDSTGAGNILLGDGSAQQVTSSSFRSLWLPNAATGTNLTGTNHLGFRLIFP